MSFLDRIEECTTRDLSAYRPLVVDGAVVGMMHADTAVALRDFKDVFEVADAAVTLVPGLTGFEARTAAFGEVVHALIERGLVKRWRDEPYAVATSFTAPAYFNIDRAAVPLFGIVAHGVHLNGWLRGADGIEMWIGRRSPTKAVSPNKLDQVVAGGQPAGLGLRENLAKECAEEADIPPELAAKAVPVGAITYCVARDNGAGSAGLRRDVLFVFDLELDDDFVPVNTDGEFAEFHRWPIERVMETVRDTREFKFNCSLVVIDFLIRHGLIEPDHPEYIELARGLRG